MHGRPTRAVRTFECLLLGTYSSKRVCGPFPQLHFWIEGATLFIPTEEAALLYNGLI